jgi:hypothetical protein
MLVWSVATLCLFGAAAVVALKYSLLGLGICIACLSSICDPSRGARRSKHLARRGGDGSKRGDNAGAMAAVPAIAAMRGFDERHGL